MNKTSQTHNNPYVGPRAFKEGEILYGRTQEMMKLLNLLIAERVVMFYSPSGAGKSSLIQAALIPELNKEDFHVLPVIRVSQPPLNLDLPPTFNRYIFSVLLSLEETVAPEQQTPPDELACLNLVDYLEQRHIASGEPDCTVLIFDQFEEILTIEPTNQEAKEEFFRQVGEALRDQRRWALFALREEYIAGLDPFLRAIPTRLNTTFRLELLGKAAAREAIKKPARDAGIPFSDGVAMKLVDDLSKVLVQQPDGELKTELGLYIEPVQLQVVCRRLWEKLPDGAKRIEEADVEAVGDVGDALAGYYAERVEAIAANTGVRERTIRNWCERELIRDQGIRVPVLRSSNRSQGLENAAIDELVDAYLVRAEERRGVTWLELAHDRLIAPVQKNNAAWRKQRRTRLIYRLAIGVAILGVITIAAYIFAFYQIQINKAKTQTTIKKALQGKKLLSTQPVNGLVLIIEATGLSLSLSNQVPAEVQSSLLEGIQLARERALLRGHEGSVNAVAFRPDGDTIGSASFDGTVRLWDTKGNLIGQSFYRHEGSVNAVAFRPDGQTIVSGSFDGSVQLWDMQGNLIAGPFKGHENPVTAVAFNPDGDTIVSGSDDGSVRLWDTKGKPVGDPFKGHEGSVTAVAFSPDGQTIVSGSFDGIVRLWDTKGNPKGQLRGHTAAVTAVAFSPDGDTIVSGSDDKTVRLWQVGWKNWLQEACNRLQNHSVWEDTQTAKDVEELIKKETKK